jgi:hypothetical protein
MRVSECLEELGKALEVLYKRDIAREPVLIALLSTAGKLAHISDCPRALFLGLAADAFDTFKEGSK